jgi:3-hydroxy-D-aspartate aldolase
MKIENIQTPALILDKKTLDENISAMNEILRGSNIKLRPHYKSHKCDYLAHLQIRNGAKGMTCAKLSEAIDLADSGIEDILIANQITDKQKISRLAHLANACRLTVCVDNKENVSDIERAAALAGSTIYCFIEFEIGMQRCGVNTKEDVAALAEHIKSCPHLVYDGIQAYAGHLSHMVSESERLEKTQANTAKIKEMLAYLDEKGLHARVLSGGSTGTSLIKAEEGLYNEIQAGSYLFMDSTYKQLGLPFENSLFILTTVVSVSDNLVVVDAGVKSCGVDQGMPLPVGFEVSHIVDSEEHLQLHNPTEKFKIGEKVLLIPAHCCSTVNLHDRIYLVDGEKVYDRLLVTARGCFR